MAVRGIPKCSRWPASLTCVGVLLLAIAAHGSATASLRAVVLAPLRAARGGGPGHSALLGYLDRPAANGPSAGVIILHGCNGVQQAELHLARRLARAGYVALIVDSLASQRFCDRGLDIGARAASVDALSGLRWLARQPWVDPARIGVIGIGPGGTAVLTDLSARPPAGAEGETFRAGVAYYPACKGITGTIVAPVLILAGGADDVTPPDDCKTMIRRQAADSAPIRLVIYPWATHGFTQGWVTKRYDFVTKETTMRPMPFYLDGHLVEYDPDAAHKARPQVRRFLRAELGPSSPRHAAAR